MRLIDADEILDGQQLYSCEELADFVKLIKEAPTIGLPTNNLLALDELRQIDGEPVYLIDKTNPGEDEWVIWDSHWTKIWIEADSENYGKTWFAYRRKPDLPTA